MSLSPLHTHLPRRSLLIIAASLFLLSFVSNYYFRIQPSIDYQRKQLERYVQKQEKDAYRLLEDSNLMRKLVLRTESLDEFRKIENKKYGFFLFVETISGQNLLYWNNHKILPPEADFSLNDGTFFQKLTNGYYVIIKRTLVLDGMSNNIVAYTLIPVLEQYFLPTAYLPTQFVHDENAIKKISLSETPTSFSIRSANNQPLFYIKRVAHTNLGVTDSITMILRLCALIFLLAYIHLVAETIVKRTRAFKGVLFLTAVLVLFRVALYVYPQLFSLRQFNLFDPGIYANDWVNRSLGDLLINTIITCWIVLFAWFNFGPGDDKPHFLKGKWAYAGAIIAIVVLIFSTFQLANVVKGLVANSKISFNVTDFFSLDMYTVVGLIVLALLCVSYYYFSRLLFRVIYPAFKDQQIYIYFLIAATGLIYLTVRSGNEIVLFHLPVLLWLLIYTLLVSQEKFLINRFSATVAGVLFWIFVFSASLAVIILQGNRANELLTRKSIAEKYDQLTDPSGERQMRIAITYLNNRFLVNNFDRFKNVSENIYLRDSIISSNLLGYSNNYDTRFYVFDSLNRPINNNEPTSYEELNTIFTLQSKSTPVPDLFYHESSYDDFTYLTRRQIKDSSRVLGTFFLVSTPRQYVNSDALYPELFRSVNRTDPESSSQYSYAVYDKKLLTKSSNKYPFQIRINNDQIPKGEYQSKVNGDYDELWYKASTQKIVVVAKKRETLLESITLFSYLFCAFLFMVGFLQFISMLLLLAKDWRSFNLFAQVNIRSQIHGTVIFISVLSFLIIGAATISFFISRYNRNNEDRLSRTAGIMLKEMEKPLKGLSYSDSLATFDSTTNLRRLVKEVADIHNVDVNIYDLDGNLEVTSDETVYNKGILSTKMHPRAYYHLNRLRQVLRVQEENVSSLQYLSIYTAVRDENGAVQKYLNVPYFSSQLDLKQEISNFLVTIINLNAFIFLIAGTIALFITNKITRSFSVIGDKMRDITLGKTNEEIVWKKNDEIGELVKQYNKMVHELEKSADALAKSEREGAWREMARQVAHEIKNPLTPMKLSIQYLQKAINTNHTDVKELTTNVANTLIEQIDHLSKIAADFSQFANIGNRTIELVDLHQVIGSLVELYKANPSVNIDWSKVEGSIILKADKTHMNRLFTNLLANAVDACYGRSKCLLQIHEERRGHSIIITIKDNGEGIPEEMRSKIFTPNFTTKTSGTGLGLAMCKSIVEQAKGNIWFETEEGKGTTFFVQLPIIS
ncbi:MAG TPA: HAMP domain-containing sensor histidine kinase [Flavisolibacter sp.]|nr:HAMP domain-containing sensor histidine kinase [Flavisolibacter sp.]